MKQSKDPFEAAFEEADDSPPDSPFNHEETETQTLAAQQTVNSKRYAAENSIHHLNYQPKARVKLASTSADVPPTTKNKEDDDEEEEENMDVELGKFSSTGDPDKMAKMQ